MKQHRIWAASLFAATILAGGSAWAITPVYVAPTGSDVTGDGTSGNPYATVQKGIDEVDVAGTVILAAGTYSSGAAVNKQITVQGAGSTQTIIQGAGTGVGLTLSAGTSAAARVVAKDLRVTNFTQGVVLNSFNTLENVEAVSNVDYGVNISNSSDVLINDSKINSNKTGIKIASTVTVSNLGIYNSQVNDNLDNGWYSDKAIGASNVSTVKVYYTTFNNNGNKGLYTEKLASAEFYGCTFDGSGNSGTVASPALQNHRAGLDINLKYGTYSGITIRDCVFNNCGKGDPNGGGLLIKQRGTGSYAANPATLTNVTVSGSKFTNCGDGTYSAGLRLGEANNAFVGADAGPSTIAVTGCTFDGNSAYALRDARLGGTQINATGNWWGTATPDFNALCHLSDNGNLNTANAWTTDHMAVYADDATGVDTNEGISAGAPKKTIAAAIAAASAGGTVNLAAGTFPLTAQVVVARAVTLQGAGVDDTTLSFPTIGTSVNAVSLQRQGIALKDLTIAGAAGKTAGQYGIDMATLPANTHMRGLVLDGVRIQNMRRTGINMNGVKGVTLTDVEVIGNTGAGVGMTDCHDVAVTNITTNGNSWGGLGIFTYGRYNPIGTDDIVISGTNSFTENANGGLYLEEGNYFTPASPYPITLSQNPADNANVTVQASDFAFSLHGVSDNNNVYTRFYTTEADAIAAANGSPDHYLANGRYIEDVATGEMVASFVNSGDSINAAIAAAEVGGTVYVNAGTYTEDVVVNKSVAVVGVGNPTVQSPGATANRTVFSVQAANVTVQGFNVVVGNNTACGISVKGTGSAATRNNVQILDNTLTYVQGGTQNPGPPPPVGAGHYTAFGSSACGISCYEPSNNGFTATISGNTIGTPTAPFPQFGIFFDRVKGDITNNVIWAEEFALEGRFFANDGTPTTSTIAQNQFFGWGDDNNKGALVDIGDFPANSYVHIHSNTITPQTGTSPQLGKTSRRAFQLKNYYGSGPSGILVENNTINVLNTGLVVGNAIGITVKDNNFVPQANNALLIEVSNKIYSSGKPLQNLQGPVNARLAQNNSVIIGNTFGANGMSNVTAIEYLNHASLAADNQTAANGNIQFHNVVLGGAGAAANTFEAGLATFIRLNAEVGAASAIADPARYGLLPVGSNTTKAPFANDFNVAENLFDVSGGAKRPAAMIELERDLLDALLVDQKDDPNLGRLVLDASPVVIAGVSTRDSGGNADHDYVVLANQTNAPVSLAGYELRGKSGAGALQTVALSGFIPAYGHYLVASYPAASSVEGTGPADQEVAPGTLLGGLDEAVGGSISLFNGSNATAAEIDGFAFLKGATSPATLGELPAFIPALANASADTYTRKRQFTSNGFYFDTQNNYNDLQVTSVKAPARDTNVPVSMSAFSID